MSPSFLNLDLGSRLLIKNQSVAFGMAGIADCLDCAGSSCCIFCCELALVVASLSWSAFWHQKYPLLVCTIIAFRWQHMDPVSVIFPFSFAHLLIVFSFNVHGLFTSKCFFYDAF